MIYVYVCMLEDYEGPSVTTESAMHKIRDTRREDCMRLYSAFVLPAFDGRFARAYQYTYVYIVKFTEPPSVCIGRNFDSDYGRQSQKSDPTK